MGKINSPTGSEFNVSVVSEKFAQELFQEMVNQAHIPFAYLEDGCYARAHEVSRLLVKKSVITGKVFVEGDLRVKTKNSHKGYIEWWYHVAPTLIVDKGGNFDCRQRRKKAGLCY